MRRSFGQLNRLSAIVMFAIYGFMSTVLSFAHTDDIRALAGCPIQHSVPHAKVVPSSNHDSECPACEWTASTHAADAHQTHIDLHLREIATYSQPIPDALHLRIFDLTLLRGPPVL